MLTIENITSSQAAANYYSNCSHYTISGNQTTQNKTHQWFGKAIEDLDIDQKQVKQSDLETIFNGIIKQKDQDPIQLGIKRKGQIIHDSGRELVFQAPKSVSLQHNLPNGDKRIKNALMAATKNTMEHIQQEYIYTRIKQNTIKPI